MGGSLSAAVGATAPPAGNGDERQLAESVAWDLALTWCEPLRGRVWLAVDTDAARQTIRANYAWVRFDFDWAPEALACGELACATRATAIAWLALSCCDGYGGRENPVFWKRVFSELQAARPGERTASTRPPVRNRRVERASVSDKNGFFENDGEAFPRFLLAIGSDAIYAGGEPEKVLQRFCEATYTTNSAVQVDADLRRVLQRLRPYVDSQRMQRVVQVGVCLRSVMLATTRPELVPVIAAYSRDSTTRLLHGSVESRQFRIVHIGFQTSSLSLDGGLDQPAWLFRAMQRWDVEVPHLTVASTGKASLVHRRVEIARSLLGVETHAMYRITKVSLRVNDFDGTMLGAVMSAVPFSRSLRTLSLCGNWRNRGRWEAQHLPWIAYALFHPQSKLSMWRALELVDLNLSPCATGVLNAMARGNNLKALLDRKPATSDAYHSARLLAGTCVQASPDVFAATIVAVSTGSMRVDVCSLPEKTLSPANGWAAVVVPAYGIGYVRLHDLHDVQAHAPSPSSLTSLRLLRYNHTASFLDEDDERHHTASPMCLLETLGPSLTSLDIAAYTCCSPREVFQICHACPSLKTLIVCQMTPFWTSAAVQGVDSFARLTQLELHLSLLAIGLQPPTEHSLALLASLQCLRVNVLRRGLIPASQHAIAALLRRLPRLRHFHWCTQSTAPPSASAAPTTPYMLGRHETLRMVSRLGVTADEAFHTQTPMPPSSILAFLSVTISRSDRDVHKSVVTRLGADALSHILAFATSRVARTIVFENEQPADE